MVTIEELKENLSKIKDLLKQAKSAVEQKTLEEIISKLETQVADRISQEANNLDEKQINEPPINFFQAIGILRGRIIRDDNNHLKIICSDKEYKLHCRHKQLLGAIESKSDPTKYYYLLVHPKAKYEVGKSATPEFLLVFFSDTKIDIEGISLNEFKLSGTWEKVSLCNNPVITIRRNKRNKASKVLAKVGESKFSSMFKAVHIPVVWKHCPIEPFRIYNDFKGEGDRYFVNIKAHFSPILGKWHFKDLLSEVTTTIPKYFKENGRPF